MNQQNWLLELQNKNSNELVQAIEYIRKEKERLEDKISILDLKEATLRLILTNKKEIQKTNKFNSQISDIINDYKEKLERIRTMFNDFRDQKISKEKFLAFLSYNFDNIEKTIMEEKND